MHLASALYQKAKDYCDILAYMISGQHYKPRFDNFYIEEAKGNADIDSIRKMPSEDRYCIYFKDASTLAFEDGLCSIYGLSSSLEHIYQNTSYTEVIWAADTPINESYCLNCMWRGPRLEACEEHRV